jgi:hypothetical protein
MASRTTSGRRGTSIVEGSEGSASRSGGKKWLRARRHLDELVPLKIGGLKPDLRLADGLQYHLFLSNVWTTGQEGCALIKARIRLLLPDVTVFQDIDDLDGADDIETNIDCAVAGSSLVLLFLSRDYFKSGQVARELRTAQKHTKPLVLVHVPEGRTSGGDSWQEHMRQCSEWCGDLWEYVFGQQWPWVPYHVRRRVA